MPLPLSISADIKSSFHQQIGGSAVSVFSFYFWVTFLNPDDFQQINPDVKQPVFLVNLKNWYVENAQADAQDMLPGRCQLINIAYNFKLHEDGHNILAHITVKYRDPDSNQLVSDIQLNERTFASLFADPDEGGNHLFNSYVVKGTVDNSYIKYSH
jgi:hypothetical protein